MTDTAVRPDDADQTAPAHPLDPATAAEYLAGREIMAAAGLLAEPVRFAYYGLAEPPKDDVLANRATDRRLRAYLVNTGTGESTDVVVSLTGAKVISARTLDPPVDGQMPILDSDFALVDEIVKADPGWRAAMARRGLHDVSQIRACPITAGAFGPPEDDRRRMVRVLAFVQAREHDLAWAHPVDGVAAYVDLIEKKVFKITDEFDLPVPAESGDYDDEAVRGPQRTTLRPIEITQPEGPSFILNGTWLQWQDWSMRIGFDAREGLTLHQVSLDERPVMYRASIPEMVVPYGDPRFRYWQAYFDSGEYLVGKWANSLELGCDCLGEIAYLDATVTDDTGQPRTIPNAICVHEEDFGILWKHTDIFNGSAQSRRQRRARGELLHHGRQLRLRLLLVLLPGRHHRVRDQGDRGAVHLGASRRRPPLLHRSRAGPRRPVPPTPVQRAAGHDRGRAGQRRGRGRRQRPADRAGQPLRQRHCPAGHPADARVPGRPPRRRRPRSYLADHQHRTLQPLRPSDRLHALPGVRAGPAGRPRRPADRAGRLRHQPPLGHPVRPGPALAAGDFVNQNPGGAGLPAFIAGDRDIDGEDIVVWHTFGPTHVPRPEDWPVMPVARCGFILKPTGFFDRNPTLDVPPPVLDGAWWS